MAWWLLELEFESECDSQKIFTLADFFVANVSFSSYLTTKLNSTQLKQTEWGKYQGSSYEQADISVNVMWQRKGPIVVQKRTYTVLGECGVIPHTSQSCTA
jgi:hypothetical protein